MRKNYYDVLGLPNTAKLHEIKRAYRRLAARFHPDKSSGKADKFREVNEAYKVLSDARLKVKYDRGFSEVVTVKDLFRRDSGRRVLDTFLPRPKSAIRMGNHQFKVWTGLAELEIDGKKIEKPVINMERQVIFVRVSSMGKHGEKISSAGDLFIAVQQPKP